MTYSKNKNLNKQTFYNILSTMLLSGINFFTIPLYTRLLGAEQYGFYAVYNSWLSILLCVMGFKVFSSLATGRYRFKTEYFEFRSSILVFSCWQCISIVLIAVVFVKPMSQFLGYTEFLLITLVLTAFARYILEFSQAAWIYEKKAGWNLTVSLITTISSNTLAILFIYYGKNENQLFTYKAYGFAVPYIIVAAIICIIIFKKSFVGYNGMYWRYGLSFGLPIVFHTLSHIVLSQSDRIMMQKMMVNDAEVGIYSFFYTFVSVLTALLTALNNSWAPFLYDDLKEGKYDNANKKVKNYVELFTIVTCGFLFLSKEICYVFANEEYWGGMPLIPLLAGAVYFTFLYQFPVNYEFFSEKPRWVAFGTCSAAGLNILLNVFFIPLYGMYGAAFTTLVSYIVLFCVHLLIVRLWKLKKYPLTLKPLALGAIIVWLGSILFYALYNNYILRWSLALIMGIYLVIKIYRRKSVF